MNADLERMIELLDALDAGTATAGTSIRLPVALRDAAAAAVRAGLMASVSEATVEGLKAHLTALVNRAVLDEHYREHPQARPEPWELAMAAAEVGGQPVAKRPDLVRRAADAMARLVEDPTPEEMVAYAAGLAAGSAEAA